MIKLNKSSCVSILEQMILPQVVPPGIWDAEVLVHLVMVAEKKEIITITCSAIAFLTTIIIIEQAIERASRSSWCWSILDC
jgi:hypothetical protein